MVKVAKVPTPCCSGACCSGADAQVSQLGKDAKENDEAPGIAVGPGGFCSGADAQVLQLGKDAKENDEALDTALRGQHKQVTTRLEVQNV